MSRRSAGASGEKRDARIIAGCLLAVEVLWWAAGVAIFLVGNFGASPSFELLGVAAGAFMFLTLLAIFLLVQAPRGGVWLGLLLQGAMLAQAVIFVFMSSIALFFAVPIALVTAIALAAAWPGRRSE